MVYLVLLLNLALKDMTADTAAKLCTENSFCSLFHSVEILLVIKNYNVTVHHRLRIRFLCVTSFC